MRAPWIPRLTALLDETPTVGRLLDLCEENYRQILEMAPDLRRLQGLHRSCRPGHMDLHLEVVEQTPYTTVIHLTYYFSHHEGQVPDPDALLRLYHDAAQVEVLDLRQSALPLPSGYQHPSLRNRWRIQLFLSKWLAFCRHQGHAFGRSSELLTEMEG